MKLEEEKRWGKRRRNKEWDEVNEKTTAA